MRIRYSGFEFLHGHGLGVLSVGKEIPEDLQFLFEAGEAEKLLIREFFYALGSRLEAIWQLQDKDRVILEHKKVINTLQTYEEVVNKSRVMRAFRVLKGEGLGSLVNKTRKNLNQK
jgi:hypothetical protein